MRSRGSQRQADRWSRQSGAVVSWKVGEEKPDLPPGQPSKAKRRRNPKGERYRVQPKQPEQGPPLSDEEGLENIRKIYRAWREPGGSR